MPNSLRSLCLSNMAEALCDKEDTDGLDFPCAFHEAGATTAFDALLSTLTEHADEWVVEAGGGIIEWSNDAGESGVTVDSKKPIRETAADLIAVLRNAERTE